MWEGGKGKEGGKLGRLEGGEKARLRDGEVMKAELGMRPPARRGIGAYAPEGRRIKNEEGET